MANLIIVITCLGIGLALQFSRRMPEGASRSLNTYVIYVALPALVLNSIPKLTLDSRMLVPVLASWALMALSAGAVLLAARTWAWSREVTGALLLTGVLGNTSFVGFPLIEAFLGEAALPYAILYDQFGTFLALNTAGITVATYFASQTRQPGALWRNILGFPPFIALLVAFPLRVVPYPLWLEELLARLAATLVPVVMVAVGLQWRLRLPRDTLQPLVFGMALQLAVTPILALVGLMLIGADGLIAKTVVLEAAMPAMISAGVLAIEYNLAPRLASSLVGYSLTFALGTVWLWSLLLNKVF